MVIDVPARSDGTRLTGLELVASFEDYAAAERAVDSLADERFPVERLNIVGRDLKLIEDVRGRRGLGGAVGEGALGGALIAGFVGVLLGLLNLYDPLISSVLLGLYGLAFGAVFGAIVGLIGHSLADGRRDFASVRSVQADRFDILAEASVAAEAKERLAE